MKGITKIGLVVCFILFTVITAVSVIWCYKTEVIEKGNTRIIIDNNKEEYKDKDGSKLPPVAIDGETYLPLEQVADLAGQEIEWDKDKKAMYIADKSDSSLKIKDVNRDLSGKVTIAHFNRDTVPKMEAYFKKAYPNVEARFITMDEYELRITRSIESGSSDVDVFAFDSSFVKKFINMPGVFADLTDKAKNYTGNMIPYTVEVGTDKNGVLRALSDNASPGAMAYKRSLAIKYLGTDEPAKIAEMLSTPDNMLQTARILKEKSGGKVALFPGFREMFRVYLGGRRKGWVVDNKLTIDQKILDFIDFAKNLRNNKYDAGFGQWSEEWSAAIADDEKAMVWLCPSWGIQWILGSHDKKATDGGKWGLVKPTYPYFWEGTWYGIYSKSPNKDVAWEFIKYFTTNKYVMRTYAIENQDFPNNLEVISKGMPEVNKIIGEDVFKFFKPFVKDINGKTVTEHDEDINFIFAYTMEEYLDGKIGSKEEMIRKFKEKVKSSFKDIIVE